MFSDTAKQERSEFTAQSETISPPDYANDMEAAHEAVEKQEKETHQAARVAKAAEDLRHEWAAGWSAFGPCLVAYLKGGSSKSMVEALQKLNGVIESVGFDESLKALVNVESFPEYNNQQDQHDAAVCKFVIGVWAEIRYDEKDEDTLVAKLDVVKARVQTENVGFIQRVIEAGGFPNCPDCSKRLAPSETGRGRCGNCIQRCRLTLRALGVAIKCEDDHDNKVYGDAFDTHFPEWIKWRRRLRECYGRDRSDLQLWEDWIGYVQEYHDIDEQYFLETLRSEAENLLPPLVNRWLPRRDQTEIDRDGERQHSLETLRSEAENLLAHSVNRSLPRRNQTEIDRNGEACGKAHRSALANRHRHAIIAFASAESVMATPEKRFTLDMAYDWVDEHYEDYQFTSRQTFKDYVTQARGKIGANVNQLRKGRSGRSIAQLSDL